MKNLFMKRTKNSPPRKKSAFRIPHGKKKIEDSKVLNKHEIQPAKSSHLKIKGNFKF